MIALIAVLGVLVGAVTVYAVICSRHKKHNRIADFPGYVFSQNTPPFNTLRYGFFRASYNGCGAVAAVNACRILGKPVHPADVISDFERFGAILFGVFGTGAFAVTHFFRKRGYRVRTTYRRSKMDEMAKAAPVSVLWYFHRRGAHFIALQPQSSSYLAYNAGSRKAAMPIDSLADFTAKRAIVARLITVTPKDDPESTKSF